MIPLNPQSDVVRQFVEIRASGTPWAMLITPDPGPMIERLARVKISGMTAPLAIVWDAAAGHTVIPPVNAEGQVLAVPEKVEKISTEIGDTRGNKAALLLAGVARLPEGSIVFLRIPGPDFWRSEICIQLILNLRDVFKKNMRSLVLVVHPGAGDTLPPQLEADVPLIREKLPGDAELGATTEEILTAVGQEPEPALIDAAVRSIRGMTIFAAENALARKVLSGQLDVPGLAELRRAAVEASTSGVLTFESARITFDDIGGLQAIKTFGDRLMRGSMAPDVIVRIDEIDKVIGANATGSIGDNTGVSQDMLRALLTAIEDNGWLFGLLTGCPGAGKTLYTTALGGTYDRLALAADFGKAKGSLVGQSERAVRNALDVIQALGGRKVLLLATANRLDTLPPELLSRAGGVGVWYFDAPDDAQRESIWAVQLAAHGFDPATPRPDDKNWVGRDIRNCCRTARMLNCDLIEASTFTMKTGVVSLPLILQSRVDAQLRGFLSAETAGAFTVDNAKLRETAAALGLDFDELEGAMQKKRRKIIVQPDPVDA